jgi:hypothetical protein
MADVAGNLFDWSTTAASNNPAGSTNIGAGLDDNLRELQKVVRQDLAHKGADIASATTTDLGAVVGLMHDITGTTTITSFGTVSAGIWKLVKFEGALTLTHNATSLILPNAANITTADGDTALAFSEGSGNWRIHSYAGKNAYHSTLTTSGAVTTNTILSAATTANVFNTVATTVNAFGAATTLTIGAATSDTTYTGQSFTLTGANSTDNTVFAVTNTSNAAAASHSYVDVSVGGTTSTGDPHIRLTIPSGTSWYAGVDNSASDVFIIGTGTAVGTTPALTLTGTTSATFAGDVLVSGIHLVGTVTDGAGIGLGVSSQTVYSAGLDSASIMKNETALIPTLYVWNATTSGDSQFQRFYTEQTAGVTLRGSIDFDRGGVLVRYNTTSDARIKKDMGIATEPKYIPTLKVHDYEFIETGHAGRGVFAQEAHKVYADAVSVGSDEVNGHGRLAKPWGVSYPAYVPDLIVGWQNHETRIAALEVENVALRARLN